MTIEIGLQLYAVRDECAKDFAGTLSAVAQMGYAGVEFEGYYGYTAKNLRALLAERGLACCGAHLRLDALLGDELKRTVDFSLELGNRYLVVAVLPEERRGTRAAWLENAGLFNDLAAQLKTYGLRLGYHNHRWEFLPIEGELPWDIFFGRADPAIIMQIDVGHAREAGVNPATVLRRYPGRATTVHMAEYSAGNPDALLGEGDVPWREVIAACNEAGRTEWYVVEQERYPYPSLECARRCLANLRSLLA